MNVSKFFSLLLIFFLFSACFGCNLVNQEKNIVNEVVVEPDPLQIRALEIALLLEDHVLAGQVLICGIDGRGSLPSGMKTLLIAHPPGGIMLFRYNLNTSNEQIKNLLSQVRETVQEESGIAPFMAVDLEGGKVNRLQFNTELPAASTLPAASGYWQIAQELGKEAALQKIEDDAFAAASEIFALGINMNFAPMAEALNDLNRKFLESRAYSHDLNFTAEAASAFIRGMEKGGVLCVVKHFPGSEGIDPHYSTSVIDLDKLALEKIVSPFASVFADGAKAVMTAHTLTPAIDNVIASLSPIVMGKWLREELFFEGIIISDDFSMAAAGNLSPQDAAVLSLAAGSDMILVWPRDIIRTHSAILAALEDGRLSRERLTEAASRIIYEKLKMGLIDE